MTGKILLFAVNKQTLICKMKNAFEYRYKIMCVRLFHTM